MKIFIMSRYDLSKLFDWCESGNATNDEFWKRFLIAAGAYPAKTQMRMAEFAALCNGRLTN